jgi:hypothetical protein
MASAYAGSHGSCCLALFAWPISHQPAVLFSHNKSVTNNQPAILFSQNKPAPTISHQPNETGGSRRTSSFWVLGLCFVFSSFLSRSVPFPPGCQSSPLHAWYDEIIDELVAYARVEVFPST